MTERELLEQIAAENMSWDLRGRSGHTPTYKVWHDDEIGYDVVTRWMGKLPKSLIKREQAAGYTYARFGPVHLTREGKARLAELRVIDCVEVADG